MPLIGGKSYQPGLSPSGGQRPAPAPQEAVNILNLRLPKSAPTAPIPSTLLTAQGGGGTSLNALLQMLMQSFGPAAMTDAAGGGREVVGEGGPGIDTGAIGARPLRPPRVRPGDTGAVTRLPTTDAPEIGEPLFTDPTAERFGFRAGGFGGGSFRGGGALF